MNAIFDKSFSKSLGKVKNKTIKRKTENFIIKVENSTRFNQEIGLKKIKGFKNFYDLELAITVLELNIRNLIPSYSSL